MINSILIIEAIVERKNLQIIPDKSRLPRDPKQA